MPRISLWQNGKHSDDYRFFDRNIAEMFTAGGTSIYIHKYLGPNNNNLKANTTAAAQTGDVTLTVADTTSISVGQFVFGIGVTNGTKVGAKTSTTVTLTQPLAANLASGGALWFSNQNDCEIESGKRC